MRDTRRTPKAVAYRAWYKTPQWLQLRKLQLAREPLCRYCKQMGIVTAAGVVDHHKPHKGDADLFFDPANLQSLCQLHHNSTKQREERRGQPMQAIGPDGWPIGT